MQYTTVAVRLLFAGVLLCAPHFGCRQAFSQTQAEQLIKSMDKDGDGRLTKDESPQELADNFQLVDANQDGFVDMKEVTSALQYQQKSTKASLPAKTARPVYLASGNKVTANEIVEALDQDGDKKISLKEASDDLSFFFSNYDKNKDGKIDIGEAESLAEYENANGGFKSTGSKGGATGASLMKLMDLNKDGKVVEEEASPQLRSYFKTFDVNGDGFLNERELEALAPYVPASTVADAGKSSGEKESDVDSKKVTPAQLVAAMDANKDGKVAKGEAPKELLPHFSNFDSNSDGKLDLAELKLLAPYVPASSIPQADTKSKKDANQTNASGAYTAKQALAFMDKNGDGKINKDEATASKELHAGFAFVDTNGDGQIDEEEFEVAMKYAKQNK